MDKFKGWAKSQGYPIDIQDNGCYCDEFTERLSEAWDAAMRTKREPSRKRPPTYEFISCNNCYTVLDKSKFSFPSTDHLDEHDVDENQFAWRIDKYEPCVYCGSCNYPIFED